MRIYGFPGAFKKEMIEIKDQMEPPGTSKLH
jgi:hypothetical protein